MKANHQILSNWLKRATRDKTLNVSENRRPGPSTRMRHVPCDPGQSEGQGVPVWDSNGDADYGRPNERDGADSDRARPLRSGTLDSASTGGLSGPPDRDPSAGAADAHAPARRCARGHGSLSGLADAADRRRQPSFPIGLIHQSFAANSPRV